MEQTGVSALLACMPIGFLGALHGQTALAPFLPKHDKYKLIVKTLQFEPMQGPDYSPHTLIFLLLYL